MFDSILVTVGSKEPTTGFPTDVNSFISKNVSALKKKKTHKKQLYLTYATATFIFYISSDKLTLLLKFQLKETGKTTCI